MFPCNWKGALFSLDRRDHALVRIAVQRTLADLDDVDIEILKTILEGVYIECQMTKVMGHY